MSEIEEVYRTIPHRPPFLFVDEILEVLDSSARARRQVRPEEFFFQGHYPGNPIMPGVLLCEAVFQTGAVLLAKTVVGDKTGLTPVLTRIKDARFKNIVRPGDELLISVKLTETLGQFHFLRGAIEAGGKKILTIDFGLAMVDENASSKADQPSAST
jgi:3-hydroxyacyl-[acyl-carrier-protein] dehydratase